MSEDSPQVVIVKTPSSYGIGSFVTGFISIFILSPVFVPISVLLGILGFAKGQTLWSILGLICAIIGVLTSPILMGLLIVGSAAAVS
jgi:hypothetical protein